MKTKIINLKQFRQNITKLWKEARKENIRFIVMHHSTPILEVLPYTDEYIGEEGDTEKSVQKTLKKTKSTQLEKPQWPQTDTDQSQNATWYRKFV